MTKNVLTDTNYRKIDIDSFDPDAFVEGDDIETPDTGILDENLILQLLQANKPVEALKAALTNPPLNAKNQVLTSVKASEIEATLSTVNAEQLDILMKYIYKAMETSQDGQTCAQLLAWHSQTFALCGHGGILRVLCSRKRP